MLISILVIVVVAVRALFEGEQPDPLMISQSESSPRGPDELVIGHTVRSRRNNYFQSHI